MHGFLSLAKQLDRVLRVCALAGGWMGALLVLVVCYDVVTRYLGVPKLAGLTSTILQEFEYWLHSALIVLALGYGYTKQAHVRVDLLRDNFSDKTKYWIEAIGISLTLLPYSILGVWLSTPYVARSFTSGEISKSQTGMSDIWILKSGLIVLFFLLGLAGLSQLIKSIAGIRGLLPDDMHRQVLEGDH